MLLKNLKTIDDEVVDITIKDGVITDIKKSNEDSSIYILPKIVDLNVSLDDANLNQANIKRLSNEAKKGGVGSVLIQPRLNPTIDNEITLEFAYNIIKDIDLDIRFCINTIQEDLSLSNIAILLKKGSYPFLSTIVKNNIAIKIAEYMQMYKKTLHIKAEDNSLISNGVMFEGDVSSKLGLPGIPELSEVVHVSRMIEIARYYGISIVFKSIYSPRSLDMIKKAKKEGIDVKAEVAIHHLIKSDKECNGYNTYAKIDPPLVCDELREKLLDSLKNGDIDLLTLLHQPNSPVNKEVAFYDASYGTSSLSLGYGLYYTYLVKSGIVDFKELVRLVQTSPANILEKDTNQLKIGSSIKDFVTFDTAKSFVVDDKSSLYNGEELFGVVKNL